MVFLEMQNKKQFENYLFFTIFATNIFLLWYNLMCFFKSHFSRNLPSQISKAVCYGIFSYASSSRLRKILSKDDSITKSLQPLVADEPLVMEEPMEHDVLSVAAEIHSLIEKRTRHPPIRASKRKKITDLID